MDGDECPLEELVSLTEKYDVTIILMKPIAPSYGENGSGLSRSKTIRKQHCRSGLHLWQAMGVHGACVSGDERLINYLINFARPFIYIRLCRRTVLLAIRCAFDLLKGQIGVHQSCKEKIKLFLNGF